MAKNHFGTLHDAFAKAESNLALTPEGNGGFELNDKTMAPAAPAMTRPKGTKPLTPAQHQAVEKAAKASVMKRRARSTRPFKAPAL